MEEDSLSVELARQGLEYEASECSQGQVVRSRLNEAVNLDMHYEKLGRFPDQFSEWAQSSIDSRNSRFFRVHF